MGTTKSWYRFYCTIIDVLIDKSGFAKRLLRGFIPPYALAANKKKLQELFEGKEIFEVFTVGGGVSAYRRKLIEQIGAYDEAFNPYGLEDVEFSIRVIEKGYKNYILGSVWLMHGTDLRKSFKTIGRDPYYQPYQHVKTRLLLCLRGVHNPVLRYYSFLDTFTLTGASMLYLSIKRRRLSIFRDYLRGIRDAFRTPSPEHCHRIETKEQT